MQHWGVKKMQTGITLIGQSNRFPKKAKPPINKPFNHSLMRQKDIVSFTGKGDKPDKITTLLKNLAALSVITSCSLFTYNSFTLGNDFTEPQTPEPPPTEVVEPSPSVSIPPAQETTIQNQLLTSTLPQASPTIPNNTPNPNLPQPSTPVSEQTDIFRTAQTAPLQPNVAPTNQALTVSFVNPVVSGGRFDMGIGKKSSGDYHEGIDILAPTGTPLRSPVEGTIKAYAYNGNFTGMENTDWNRDCGNAILIETPLPDGNAMLTLICHLDSINQEMMTLGAPVNQTTQLGTVGNTGRSDEPHAHIEVTINRQASSRDYSCTQQGNECLSAFYVDPEKLMLTGEVVMQNIDQTRDPRSNQELAALINNGT